ncbi:MAG: DUF503 domain-containing protein [Halanaerobiales bacterium]
MKIGAMKVELYIPAAASLKDKRNIIKSIMEQCRNKFNVSISEIDKLDLWKNSVIGLGSVSNDSKMIEKIFQGIIKYIDTVNEVELTDYTIDYY